MPQDFSGFRPSRIWKRLPVERRTDAAELFWKDDQSAEQQVEACASIAGFMKFRAKTVLGLPVEKKTQYLIRLPNIPDAVAARALVAYHFERQRPMMSAFLDALGISHDNGLIDEDAAMKPEPEKLRAAAESIAGQYAADDVSLYFATLIAQDPDTWGELADLPQMTASPGGGA